MSERGRFVTRDEIIRGRLLGDCEVCGAAATAIVTDLKATAVNEETGVWMAPGEQHRFCDTHQRAPIVPAEPLRPALAPLGRVGQV
jgi:hypothetical protein